MQTIPFLFFHAYVLPTGSMENTLIIGDHFLVRQFPKPKIRDGDLVVFRYPLDPRQIFTKRVIGAAGDRIRIASRVVYRNGTVLTEPYVIRSFAQEDDWRDNFPHDTADVPRVLDERSAAAMQSMLQNDVGRGELIVPQGKYFVLGDNRDNSLDSRYWGLVDDSEIIGKPVLIYYSPGHWERLMKLL
jgi:signal peptidase I